MPIIKYRHFWNLSENIFRRVRRSGTRALPPSSRGWLGPPCRAGPPRQWLPAHSMFACGSRRGPGRDRSSDTKKHMVRVPPFSLSPPPLSPGRGGHGNGLDSTRPCVIDYIHGNGVRLLAHAFPGQQRGGWASFFMLFLPFYRHALSLSIRPQKHKAW